MPNYVNNRLEIHAPSKERLEEILASIKSKRNEEGTGSVLDFNSIDPMPEDLDEDFFLVDKIAARWIIKDIMHPAPERWAETDWDTLTDQLKEAALSGGRRMIENILKHGHPTYCDWARAHWGTKWNAMEADMDEDNVICFQTAWSDPCEVLKTLSKRFPDTTFKNTYADENCGENCGVTVYVNGEASFDEPVMDSVEAYELSFSLWPDRRELFVLTENGYEMKED